MLKREKVQVTGSDVMHENPNSGIPPPFPHHLSPTFSPAVKTTVTDDSHRPIASLNFKV